MSSPIDIGNAKQLFIDERWFASRRGVRLCVNPPAKAEYVLMPETPWESRGIIGFNTILEHDGEYHLWYDSISTAGRGDPTRCLCYATSRDGIQWERRNVNLFAWGGIDQNNIVMPGAEGVGVMIDPNGPDEHRFKALAIIKENELWSESRGCICELGPQGIWMELYLLASPDGVHWRKLGPALPFFHDTQNQFFHDSRLGKYVAYVRAKETKPIRAVGRVEFDDPLELPWPHTAKPNAPHGPGITRGSSRCADIPIVLCTDADDPGESDFYNPCVHQYPWAADAYFAFPSFYRHYPIRDEKVDQTDPTDQRGRLQNDGPLEIQLATSREGIHWNRPDRRPYVPLGLQGTRDGGSLYMSIGMIRKGDEIWQYYCGLRHTHGATEDDAAAPVGGLRRLVQRLDGFVSADTDYAGGEFATPPLVFAGAHLRVNVDCSAAGELWVGINDERGSPLPGYGIDDCISVDRNQTDARVVWRNHGSAAQLIGRPVCLHFRAHAAKLYAFQFADETE